MHQHVLRFLVEYCMLKKARMICRDVLFDKEWKAVLETTHGLSRALHWRKGDHWKSLIRKHAQLAVNDEQLVDAFSKDCMKCHVGLSFPPTLKWCDHAQQEGPCTCEHKCM